MNLAVCFFIQGAYLDVEGKSIAFFVEKYILKVGKKMKGVCVTMAKNKKNIKQLISGALVSAGNKAADISCGQSCVYLIYQPKQPKAMKKKNSK